MTVGGPGLPVSCLPESIKQVPFERTSRFGRILSIDD